MKFFSRNNELSNPVTVVNSCLKFLIDRIADDLGGEGYHWNKPWGIKRFESIVLAKFILDFSFERIIDGQLSDDEKMGYYELSNSSLSKIFNQEFSEVGMNFKDMQQQIEEKVEAYFDAWKENRRPPECYYQIYMLITGCQSREELEEESRKTTVGLELMRNNKNFAPMVIKFEAQINHLKEKVVAYDLAEIMLPHMMRSAKQKLKKINLKKIKSLSKKLSQKNKK